MTGATRLGVLVTALVGFVVFGIVTSGGRAAECEFRLGFKALRDQIPEIVGDCQENEGFNPANGNAEQRTSGGLLVWRKVDNWTAFTDGVTTWLDGPLGLQSRPNTERFDWEAAPEPTPSTVPGPSIPPGAEPLLQSALADAAQRSGLDPSAISVLKVEARQWPDASLGCPKPNALYAKVITPGYEILLQAGGQQLSYHTDSGRRVELCLQASR
jgi:hypothetical protein